MICLTGYWPYILVNLYTYYVINIADNRLKVKVYYDDAMKNTYSSQSKVTAKLRSVMVYVEEMFQEKDTLTTTINIDSKNLKIEHLPGQNWEMKMR